MKTYDHVQLPAEIQQLFRKDEQDDEAKRDRVESIGKAVAKKRDLAVAARRESGIEQVWIKAEEAWIGMDNANRGEFKGAVWTKPMTSEGPLTREMPGTQAEARSTLFFRLTARYVDMGAAKLAELLIPTDDKPFSFGPTPLPSMAQSQEDDRQIVHNGQPLQRDATPEEQAALAGQAPPSNPTNPLLTPEPPIPQKPGEGPGVPLTPADLAKEALERAEKKAKKAETRVEDWMVEANMAGEMTRSFTDASKLGVAVMKGPFPKIQRNLSRTKGADDKSMVIEFVEKIIPGYERRSPWSIYPDPTCGEVISKGEYLQADRFSKSKLENLAGEPDYLVDQLLLAMEEGPNKKYADANNPNQPKDDDRYEVWFFYGRIEKADFLALEEALPPRPGVKPRDPKSLKSSVFVIATMVNDRIIKCVENPLDSGTIPYHNFSWSIREGQWAGIGVAEQIDTPQRMVNGALRGMLDNAGLSSGVNIVLDLNVIEPLDGNPVLGRNKLWRVKAATGAPEDIRKAFMTFQVPSVQKEMDGIIQLAMTLAEHSVNIPLISQGQSGPTQPDTARGLELQDNNANQLLRDIARRYDDSMTEPIVRLSYEYLLLDPDVPEDEKGDYQIHAHGSVSIVNRTIQRQIIQGLGAVVKDPAYGLSPRKWMTAYLRGNQITPMDLQYTEEEQKKIDSQPPPKLPQVQVAEIKAQVDLQKSKTDTDRDTAYVQAQTDQTRTEHEAKMAELALKRELAMLDYANTRQISLDEVKAELSQTVMKLQVQRELAAHDRAAEVLKPPTEPAGRAPNGQSFER